MVGLASKSAGGEAAEHARAEAPRFEKVSWTKEPHLRKLYFLTVFLLIASATTGYDGMLANTCQQMDLFKVYFDNVFTFDAESEKWSQDANLLGIMINMFNIGSIISFFITPYAADYFGRKLTIMTGCLIMIVGACVSAFTNSYDSEQFPNMTRTVGMKANDGYSVASWPIPSWLRKLACPDVFSHASN